MAAPKSFKDIDARNQAVLDRIVNTDYPTHCRFKDISGNDYGYLIFAEKNVERIWQSENKALMLHFAKTYATKLYCETLVNSKESK